MAIILDMLAAPFALKKLREAREMLKDVTPLHSDCGRVCGCACCKPDETGENGMLLFPFEDRFYRKPIEGFSFHLVPDDTLFKGGTRLVCMGECPREHRPLACRIFPLRIRLICDEQGENTHAEAEVDPRAWAVCPLPEQGGLRAISADFTIAVQNAGNLLCRNVYMLEALLNEQRTLDETRRL